MAAIYSDINIPIFSSVGQGPQGPQGEPGPQGPQGEPGDIGPTGDSIAIDVTDDYGNYVLEFKNSRTGEVLATSPNMDPGSHIFLCYEVYNSPEEGEFVIKTSDLQAVTSSDLVRTHDIVIVQWFDSVWFCDITDSAYTDDKIKCVGLARLITLAAGSVNSSALANNSVTTLKIAEGAVKGFHLATGAVEEPKIANGAVSNNKLSQELQNFITRKGYDLVFVCDLGNDSNLEHASASNTSVVGSILDVEDLVDAGTPVSCLFVFHYDLGTTPSGANISARQFVIPMIAFDGPYHSIFFRSERTYTDTIEVNVKYDIDTGDISAVECDVNP